jgi:inhibitor of KinA sporulation pathway (predicted exonuclease)
MHYIIFDLEFNQDFHSSCVADKTTALCPFEIIQIGAIKTDSSLKAVATFNRYIKPSIYMQISSFVSDLTGINTEQLSSEKPFPVVFDDFIRFIGEDDSVFCSWGMSDMKELYRNTEYHKLDKSHLPSRFINLQPYVSTYLKLPVKKLLNLQAAVNTLRISTMYQFHNALYDAFYTAKIFQKIYSPDIQSIRYQPNFISIRPRQPKKVIDYEKLIQQFEKMYARKLSDEEQNMITLAYKMGKTNQFVEIR